LIGVIDSLYNDSLGGKFTIRLTTDSAKLATATNKTDSDRYGKVLDNPFFPRTASPRDGFIAFRQKDNKDTTFYLVTGILLLLVIIRIGFPSYFSRLFQYFFQTSMRQRQTRDRLLQEQFAAIGLNLLFFVVMGTFVTLLAFWRGWYLGNFWLLWAVATGFLGLIYAGKFILEMQVDEYDILKIKKGLTVLVTLESYKGKVFEALVTKINPLMNERSKTFLVEAEFVKQPEILYPNISFEANIVINSKEKAILIPRDYLLNDSFVVKPNGDKIAVKTGLKDYQKIEIISGINAEDELVKPKE
jgi:hypothetical protein